MNCKQFIPFFLILLFLVSISASIPSAHAVAISLIQSKNGTIEENHTIVIVLNAAPTSGNLLIATVGTYYYTDSPVYSFSQGGVTWSLQKSNSYTDEYANPIYNEIWIGVVGSGASDTLSIALTYDVFEGIANVFEFTGLSTSSFLDRTAEFDNNGVTSLVTGTTTTTSQASELWIGSIFGRTYEDQSTPTNSFTLYDTFLTECSLATLYKIVSATGAANSGTSIPYGHNGAGAIITVKAPYSGTNYPVGVSATLTVSKGVGITWGIHIIPSKAFTLAKTASIASAFLVGVSKSLTIVKNTAVSWLASMISSKVLTITDSVSIGFSYVVGLSQSIISNISSPIAWISQINIFGSFTIAKTVSISWIASVASTVSITGSYAVDVLKGYLIILTQDITVLGSTTLQTSFQILSSLDVSFHKTLSSVLTSISTGGIDQVAILAFIIFLIFLVMVLSSRRD